GARGRETGPRSRSARRRVAAGHRLRPRRCGRRRGRAPRAARGRSRRPRGAARARRPARGRAALRGRDGPAPRDRPARQELARRGGAQAAAGALQPRGGRSGARRRVPAEARERPALAAARTAGRPEAVPLRSMPNRFRESNLFGAPMRDLGLTIDGTRLAPVIEEFRTELAAKGITKVVPTFYLSTEWGVVFGTVAIGIPFYLARPELTELHGEEVGHIEGFSRADILRYLRHEMGHVVNYAYKLYDREDWVKLFGSITQPYREAYRPQPFSRRFVRHLPGWYAQKHPDEDWSETFAVWMTPGRDWRAEYAQAPTALAKLEYCDRTMAELAEREPLVTATELDEDITSINMSLQEYYKLYAAEIESAAAGLDGD